MNNAFTKLAASIVFRKQAGDHSKIWKTVGKNAPLFALGGGLAGAVFKNPENISAIVDAPGAALNSLLSPITKHLPDSILERNPLKDSARKALTEANLKDLKYLEKSIREDYPGLLTLDTAGRKGFDFDALGLPKSMKSGGGNILDMLGYSGTATGDNGIAAAFRGISPPIFEQNMLNALSQIPGDFGKGALIGTAALGGIGAGLSSGSELGKAILRKRHPIAMALNERVITPLRSLRSRD